MTDETKPEEKESKEEKKGKELKDNIVSTPA